jgi:hypothetical protein
MKDTTEYSRIQIARGNKIDCAARLVHATPRSARSGRPLLEIALQNV